MRRADHFIGGMPRFSCLAEVQTFHASDFAGKRLTVVNTKDGLSFVKVGVLRQSLGAGEEAVIEVPAGADYRIGLGPGVRLLETL